MSDAIRIKYENLNDSWANYLGLLEKAELKLKEKQDEFQEMLLLDQEKFKEDIKQFGHIWKEYKETAAANPDLDSDGT